MQKFRESLIESLSLTVFVVYIQLIAIEKRQDWLLPYALSTGVALLSTLYLWRCGLVLNRINLAINLYFVSGLMGLMLGLAWLNQLYGQLRGAGMLYWILAVGLIASTCSPFGFLGIKHVSARATVLWSLALVAVCGLAIIIAQLFMSSRFWGEWFPFILVFTMRGLLIRWSRPVLA
jgi:hypothetical protein